MKQEINFLKALPKEPIQLPAQWITLIVIATLALLTVISLGMGMTQIKDAWALRQVHHAHTEALTVFQKTAKLHPLLASETPVVEQIALLKTRLKNKQIYYEDISRSALRYGFSNYLGALADVIPEGVWLNEMMIDQTTKNTSLSGYALQPVKMSLFLEALQKAEPFAGTTFGLFSMKAIPKKAYIEFKITNTQADLG